MELFKLLGTVAIETGGATKSIDDVTGKVEKAEGKLSKTFEKIGSAVVAAFATDKIVDFGVACLDAAANAEAVSSQFSQVFGDFEETAAGSLSQFSKDAGISENRLKGSYTKIAAFAKTTGMKTEDALSLADRALVAVADSAAFYDRSLEDTTESLQSFLKGNYENDAALGLSCTETTRNAKANELYGQSFKDLSESQKQLTLLAMVEDANKLSGAIGQAARESDTWTNQTGNLSQAWTDFKAEVGDNFLDVAIDGVKTIARWVERLTTKIKPFFGWVEKLISKVKPFFGWIQDTAVPVASALWESIQDGCQAVTPVIEETIGTLSGLAERMVGVVSEIFGKLSSELGNAGGMFTDLGENIIGPFIELHLNNMIAKFETMVSVLETVFLPIIKLVIDAWFNIAQSIYENVMPSLQNIMDKFNELSGLIRQAVNEYIMPTIQGFISMVEELYAENEDKLNRIGELYGAVFELISNLVSAFVGWFEENFLPFLKNVCDYVAESMDEIKAIFQNVIDFVTGIIEAFIALFKGDWEGLWEAVVSALEAGVSAIENLFSLLAGVIGDILNAIWSKVVAVWEAIKTAIYQKVQAIVSSVKEKFEDIKKNVTDKMNSLKNSVANIFENIKASISNAVNSAKNTVTEVFGNIVSTITDKMDEAKKAVSNVIEKIKGLFDFEWSLPKLKLPHIVINGEWDLSEGKFPSFDVEWYAKGAVLNKPTVFGMNPATGNAMVGGEAGAEAVAPIDVLQGYVREAVNGSNAELVSVLKAILAAIMDLDAGLQNKLINALISGVGFEVNGREFGRLVRKYA